MKNLKENKKIHYLLKAFKHLGDEAYMDFFLERETNPLLLEFVQEGGPVIDKKVLLIPENGNGWGFFAEFRAMLAKMLFADRFDLIPHVEWGPAFLYAEKEEVYGTANAYEYYFKQPMDLTKEELSKGSYVARAKSMQGVLIEREFKRDTYDITEEYKRELARIYHKYVRLNERTKKALDDEMTGLLNGKKTLGVHYRGTDYKVGYDIHPVGVKLEQALQKAEELFKQGDFEQIFLATDETQAAERFQEKFKDRVVFYQDVCRSDSDVSVAFSRSERENHHYLLGYEVIRDMYTLAACSGLLAGLSQVVTCARIVKESEGGRFEPMVIINNGINHSNIKFKG